MRLFVDCRPLSGAFINVERAGYFAHGIMLLAAEKPQVKCRYLLDQLLPAGSLPDFPKEATILKRPLPGKAGWKLWNEWQVPQSLEKAGSDILLMIGGIASAHSAVPQAVWIPEWPDQAANAREKTYSRMVMEKLPLTVRLANTVFTGSEKIKKDLVNRFPELDDKIFVLRACPQEGFLPLSWEEKEAIKQGFAGGKEYFLVRFQAPDSKDLVFILKAFSQFKKRQHSNVQLLITLMDTGGNKEFNHKLETYKYRKEVHLVAKPDRTTLAKIMAGAYAFIQPGDQEQDIINAFKAETPVIRLSADRNPGIYEGALLLAATGEQDQLTEQLKRLYKDESLRAELVAKAKQIAASRSWQDLVASLWNGLSRSMGSKKE